MKMKLKTNPVKIHFHKVKGLRVQNNCCVTYKYSHRLGLDCLRRKLISLHARNSKAVKFLNEQNKKVKSLDVGTGTGLLSVMAGSAGANIVTSCEHIIDSTFICRTFGNLKGESIFLWKALMRMSKLGCHICACGPDLACCPEKTGYVLIPASQSVSKAKTWRWRHNQQIWIMKLNHCECIALWSLSTSSTSNGCIN